MVQIWFLMLIQRRWSSSKEKNYCFKVVRSFKNRGSESHSRLEGCYQEVGYIIGVCLYNSEVSSQREVFHFLARFIQVEVLLIHFGYNSSTGKRVNFSTSSTQTSQPLTGLVLSIIERTTVTMPKINPKSGFVQLGTDLYSTCGLEFPKVLYHLQHPC